MKKRKSWPKYFIDIAKTVAERSTCDKLSVGAVIVKGNRILCTGYNGALPGREHCDEIGHDLDEQGHCVRVIHAEQNAICQAAKYGINLSRSSIYVTHSPCFQCYKLIMASGIIEIQWDKNYHYNKRMNSYMYKRQGLGIQIEDFSIKKIYPGVNEHV